jgi:apolipoprotein N-acyltransferase
MRKAAMVVLASAGSGILLCTAIPPGTFSEIGWFCLVPLLIATRGKGFLYGFFGALLAVFTCAMVAETGIFYSEKHFGGNDAWLYSACGIFGFSISIACGIWAEKGLIEKPAWWFAAIATLLESVMLLYLPGHLAMTQWRSIGILQICSIGGVWLLSFLVWWVNFSFAELIANRKWNASLALLGLLGILGFSSILVPKPAIAKNPDGTNRIVSVIQVGELESDTISAIHKSVGSSTDLVVWPEFAGLAFVGGGDSEPLKEFAKQPGIAPFVTSFGDLTKPLPHNTAAVFDSEGESARYFKRKPFGTETKMYLAGNLPVAIGAPHNVGLNICFDSCFGFVIRDTINAGEIDFIALPTIDPDSPHRFLAANHAAHSAIRSAELGISIARSDGFGFSSITDSYGRFIALKKQGDGTVSGNITKPHWTLARFVGDWFLAVCGAMFIVGIALVKPIGDSPE